MTSILDHFLPKTGSVESFDSKLLKRSLNRAEVEKAAERINQLHNESSRRKLSAPEFEKLKEAHGTFSYGARIRDVLTRLTAAHAGSSVVFDLVRPMLHDRLTEFNTKADECLADADCLIVGSSVLESTVFESESGAAALKADSATVGKASYDIGVLISALLFAHYRAIDDCVSDDSFEKRFAAATDDFCKALMDAYARSSGDSEAISNDIKFLREVAFVAGCELLQRLADANAAGKLSDSMRNDAAGCAGRALHASTKVDSFGRFLFIVFMYC